MLLTLFFLSAAIPPTRGRSSSSNRPTGNQIYRTSSTNSASVILEGLPDFKPPERQYVVYHWGGGITSPTKLTLPQHDSDVVQVASGRTLKTGVTGGGRMIIWDSNKKAVNVSSDAADKGMLEDLWVPRFLEGQSGVTIVQVSCGDLFVACLTGTVCVVHRFFFVISVKTTFTCKNLNLMGCSILIQELLIFKI